jgi:hypothetical protein
MNPTREAAPDCFAAVEAVTVTDEELPRIEGGIMNVGSLPLIVVKFLELLRTPPTAPR